MRFCGLFYSGQERQVVVLALQPRNARGTSSQIYARPTHAVVMLLTEPVANGGAEDAHVHVYQLGLANRVNSLCKIAGPRVAGLAMATSALGDKRFVHSPDLWILSIRSVPNVGPKNSKSGGISSHYLNFAPWPLILARIGVGVYILVAGCCFSCLSQSLAHDASEVCPISFLTLSCV